MPTYQYACTECGEQLEAVQTFSDPALTECPECQGKLRKVFNSVGIVFKGSGFYRNDSRPAGVGADKANSSADGKSDSKAAESSSSSSDTSSAAKPAASSSPSTTSSSTTAGSGSSSEGSKSGSSGGAKAGARPS